MPNCVYEITGVIDLQSLMNPCGGGRDESSPRPTLSMTILQSLRIIRSNTYEALGCPFFNREQRRHSFDNDAKKNLGLISESYSSRFNRTLF